MDEQFPFSFGKYRMEAEIGRGGFGTVFRALDVELDRPLAIKILDPLYMRDGRWVSRFRREARLMAKLEHPNIVPIYEIGEQEGRLFLAMRIIDGPDLTKIIEEKGALPWDDVLEMVGQIASALDYAHQHGVIHRDLKPGNILVSKGQAMLTDFGLAQMIAGNSLSISVSGGIAGTYNYMPPEIFKDEKATPAADVYALGCVVYEMLTGQMLFDGQTTAAIISAHLEGVTLNEPLPEGTPPGTHQILQTALAKDPRDRYASAAEMVQEMQRVTRDRLTASAAKGGLPRWIWWISALAVLIFAIWAVFFRESEVEQVDVTRIVEIEVTRVVEAEPAEEVEEIEPTPEPTKTPTINPTETTTPTATKKPAATPSPTPNLPPLNPELGSIWSRPVDQMRMVYVPAGSFMMGSEDGYGDEQPVHEVTLDGFWIDRTEVTNSQYAGFLNERGNQEEGGVTWLEIEDDSVQIEEKSGGFAAQAGFADHPVIEVSWYGAAAYCDWLGGQLPTEAQWEYAARGPQSLTYPWGPEFDGQKSNYCDQNCSYDDWKDESIDDGYSETAPVGSYKDGASWIGALDMAGNVWEWVNDWYDDSYYATSPEENPEGPASGDLKVLRGGSWTYKSINLRGANRGDDGPAVRNVNLGFRCVLPGK